MPVPRAVIERTDIDSDLAYRIVRFLGNESGSAYSDKEIFLVMAPQPHIAAMDEHIESYRKVLKALVAHGDIVTAFTRGQHYYASNHRPEDP